MIHASVRVGKSPPSITLDLLRDGRQRLTNHICIAPMRC